MSWQCDSCGFGNRPQNEVCGGAGPMGCKAPRMGGGGGFGPAKGKKGGGKSSPYGPVIGAKGGEWACNACGFANRAANDVCGGNGPMGCKTPRGGMSGKGGKGGKMPMMMAQPVQSAFMQLFGKGGGGAGGSWQCGQCGFSNKPQNEVCGGNGPMGCKAPAPSGGGMMKGCGKGKGKMSMPAAKGQGKGKWACEACGFTNGDRNEVCGGAGPMGCKLPKPSNWVCDCGFLNKPTNDVCGGRGPMGCKEPRPSGELM